MTGESSRNGSSHGNGPSPGNGPSHGNGSPHGNGTFREPPDKLAFAVDALEHLPFGVVAFDAHGAVRYVSRLAAEILKRQDGICLRGDTLRATESGESHKLMELIASSLNATHEVGAAHGQALAITRPSGARPYVLQIFPRAFAPVGNGSSTSGAVLFIHDPEGRNGTDGEWLRALYGLTPAEAKLASLLSCGLSPATAALELHITINTARTHIKRLYSKTGTNRQPELVRLLVSMLAVGSVASQPRQDEREREKADL